MTADEALASMRKREQAATKGPWRWVGNADYPDSIHLESRDWVIIGMTRRERSMESREAKEAIEALREFYYDDFITAKDRERLGGDDEALEALLTERATERVRDEWLNDPVTGEARQDHYLRLGSHDRAQSGIAADLPIFEVGRNQKLPDDTPRDHPKIYRADIVGLRNANATFMAAARTDMTKLLDFAEQVLATCDGDDVREIAERTLGS